MDRVQFERLVAEALDGIPAEFSPYLANVAVVIEEEPSRELLFELGMDAQESLYGLYQGTPLPARPHDFAAALPDRITIFAGPLLRDYPTAAALRHEIRATVVHEIAHFFGLDERCIRRLGF